MSINTRNHIKVNFRVVCTHSTVVSEHTKLTHLIAPVAPIVDTSALRFLLSLAGDREFRVYPMCVYPVCVYPVCLGLNYHFIELGGVPEMTVHFSLSGAFVWRETCLQVTINAWFLVVEIPILLCKHALVLPVAY